MMGVIIPMERLRKRMGKKEYIEREALSQAILDLPPKMDEQGYGWLGRRGVWQMVNDFPAADVRPVTVCTNCEHNNHCLTQEFVEDCGKIPLDRNTFFCADGERRSNA